MIPIKIGVNKSMYLVHSQSGYFQSVTKMVAEILNEPYKFSKDPNERGTWILFFPSYLSGFYTKIKDPYILVNTEQHHIIFERYPEYKKLYDNAIRVLDFTDNLQFGYSNSSRLECEEAKDIDVLFYGVLTSRRKKIVESINVPNKVVFSSSPPIHGSELWKYINRSKIVLNLFRFENMVVADWVRLAPLLSNKSFVITESFDNKEFMSLKNHLVIVDYDKIIPTIDYFLKNPLKRIEMADKGFDYIRNNRPTKIL